MGKHHSPKKRRSLELREMTEDMEHSSAVYTSLAYAMEKGYLCMGRLQAESFLEQHYAWVLSLNRSFALLALVHGLEPSGYALVRLSALSEVRPEPQLTEQWTLLGNEKPALREDADSDLLTLLASLADGEVLSEYLCIGSDPRDSLRITGRIVKLGKKRLTVRELDAYELVWHAQPSKLPYERLDLILFDTPLLHARETLSMSYDAFIRSLNESVDLPADVEDMDGEDVREAESEDMVDLDDLALLSGMPSEEI